MRAAPDLPSGDEPRHERNGLADRPQPPASPLQELVVRSLDALCARAAPATRTRELAELIGVARSEAQAAAQTSADCARSLQTLAAEVAALRERVRALEAAPRASVRPTPRPAPLIVRRRSPGRLWSSVWVLARDDTLWVPLFAIGVGLAALVALIVLSNLPSLTTRSSAAPVATITTTAAAAAEPALTASAAPAQTTQPASVAPAARPAAAAAVPEPTSTPAATPTMAPSPTPAWIRSEIASDGSGARLRAEPSTQATVVEVLADGAQVAELESELHSAGRTWRRVEAPSGKVGWIDRELLRTPASPPPSAAGERSDPSLSPR